MCYIYERRSVNRWYKSKSDKPLCIEIGGQKIAVHARHEPFIYLGKPVTMAGEPKDLIRNIIDENFGKNCRKCITCSVENRSIERELCS